MPFSRWPRPTGVRAASTMTTSRPCSFEFMVRHFTVRSFAKLPGMARRSVADALLTRQSIVRRATDVASVEGLEGVTIGRLAGDLHMSKAGVIGHFGTKAGLQREALLAASERFVRDVWEPAADERPGLARLLAVCDNWVAHVSRPAFPGGCFWTAAACEPDGRRGPARDELVARPQACRRPLRRDLRIAAA